MPLYNLRSLTADTFMICKFSDDFEVESTYTLTKKGFSFLCDCPANARSVVTKPCRHKLMMPTLLPAVDTDRFYDHETGKFSTPLGDLFKQDVGEALRDEAKLLMTEPSSLIDEAVPSTIPASPSAPSQAPIIRRR